MNKTLLFEISTGDMERSKQPNRTFSTYLRYLRKFKSLRHLCFESFASILPRTVLTSGLRLPGFLLREFRGAREFRFRGPRDQSGFLFGRACILSKRWRRISGSAQPFPHSVKVEKDLLLLAESSMSASG